MRSKPVAALLTDFGTSDPYVGVMKGVIARFSPQACIIDLCHGVPPQDIRQGAFQLLVSAPYFPEGALFVCIVDPGVGSSRPILYAETAHHRFLAPDNGLLSLMLRAEAPRIVRSVQNKKLFLSPVSRTFHGRDIFAPVAGRLLAGLSPRALGPSVDEWVRLQVVSVSRTTHRGIEGVVLSIDRFGNAISSIHERWLARLGSASRLRIRVGRSRHLELKKTYAEGEKGRPFAVVGSFGYIEVAVRNGNAAEKLNVSVGDPFSISFSPDGEKVRMRG